MTDDGFVNVDDLNDWIINQKKTTLGDANLDFFVDGSDFNIWNDNKFAAVDSWTQADFNADGVVDASDFNIWFSNRFTPSAAARSAPSGEHGRQDRLPRQAAAQRPVRAIRAIATDSVFAESLERRATVDKEDVTRAPHHDNQGAQDSQLSRVDNRRQTSQSPRRFVAQSRHETSQLVDEALGDWHDEFTMK